MTMVILTINGRGNRFLEAGIMTPKFMLEYKNTTVIKHIIANLKSGFSADTNFHIGLNKIYIDYIPYLEKSFRELDMIHEIIILDDSKGQADTVRVLVEKIGGANAAMWVVNCDTLVNNNWRFEYSMNDIVIEVFESNLPVYSYIDCLEKVSVIAEKKVISNLASTGNYFFKDSKKFLELFYQSKYNGEIFISDVIQEGIDRKLSVIGNRVSSGSVKVLGTPIQYEKNI